MTRGPTDPARRRALRLLAAVGVAPLAAGTASLLTVSGCSPQPQPSERALRRLLAQPDGMAVVGRSWLASQPGTPTVASLVEVLGIPEEEAAPSDAALRDWLAEQQTRDWLAGHVTSLDGFRVTRTEARVYGLAALFAEPNR